MITLNDLSLRKRLLEQAISFCSNGYLCWCVSMDCTYAHLIHSTNRNEVTLRISGDGYVNVYKNNELVKSDKA